MLFCHCAYAQVDSLLHVGDSYYSSYRFDDALDVYEQVLYLLDESPEKADTSLFSSVYEKVLLSENGSNMSGFVRKPKVVGRKKFSLDEFFLYYPVENRSWRPLPNCLDHDSAESYVRALYAPDWNNVHYYSAKDENGVRSIYMTELSDTIWSVPQRVEELSTEGANEIYPMLSPDGRTIYFASDGLYGIGGYDIYRSEWNDEERKWSMPQNMGMPFSSPEDDFLFVDSDDDKYCVFASTRGCQEDSVWVYAIENEKYPLHSPVDDPEELLKISYMNPVEDTKTETTSPEQDDLMKLYSKQMNEVRAKKDSIAVISKDLEDLRTDLALSDDEENRFEISADIIELEKRIPLLQKELEQATAELQNTEAQFLKRGVFVVPIQQNTAQEERKKYDFVKLAMGYPLELDIAVPEEKFDYSFRILDEAVFAEDQSLPSGVIYQIQLLGGSHEIGLTALKGLSPIYLHRSPSGMYIYRVGRFATYSEALDCVYKVRELGFKSAYLCAFNDGQEISVAAARTLQEQLRGGFSLFEVTIMPDSGELDSFVIDIINDIAVGKDIMRSESEDGTQIFSVGPFDDQNEAEEVVSAIKSRIQGLVVCRSLLDN